MSTLASLRKMMVLSDILHYLREGSDKGDIIEIIKTRIKPTDEFGEWGAWLIYLLNETGDTPRDIIDALAHYVFD